LPEFTHEVGGVWRESRIRPSGGVSPLTSWRLTGKGASYVYAQFYYASVT
jgi:hypothetical protein